MSRDFLSNVAFFCPMTKQWDGVGFSARSYKSIVFMVYSHLYISEKQRMHKMLLKIQTLVLILFVTGCTHQNITSKHKDEWAFAHMAAKAQITSNQTIVMPVTQNIIAFTMDPYQTHADMNGMEFIALLNKSKKRGRIVNPRNAVLSWFDGKNMKETRLVVTSVQIDKVSENITYITEGMSSFSGSDELVSPHLYLDRYAIDRKKLSEKHQYPFTAMRQAIYTGQHRIPGQTKSKSP